MAKTPDMESLETKKDVGSTLMRVVRKQIDNMWVTYDAQPSNAYKCQ
jgi:hypothetical protein